MNRNFIRLSALLSAALSVAACSDSPVVPGDPAPVQTTGTNSQSDTTRGNGNNGGTFAGIRIVPHAMRVVIGSSVAVNTISVDANGVPTQGPPSGRATLTVGNTSIARLDATGTILTGVAAGQTMVYATLGTFKDSASVLVATTADTIPTPAPVGSFSLLTYAFTRIVPTADDTSSIAILSGAEVSLYRVTAPSTTANPGGTRVLVRTVTSDASGQALFSNLPPDSYSVSARATFRGATYETRQDFTTPYTPNYVLTLFLTKP